MRFFLLETDVVIESIDRVIAAAAGETHAHGEALSVLRYRPGETYRAHHDYANPDWPRLGGCGLGGGRSCRPQWQKVQSCGQ